MFERLAEKIARRVALEITAEDVAQRIATPRFASLVAEAMPRPPMKCPVCDGSGAVAEGFYHTSYYMCWDSTFVNDMMARYSDGYEGCRTCKGSGVWR